MLFNASFNQNESAISKIKHEKFISLQENTTKKFETTIIPT